MRRKNKRGFLSDYGSKATVYQIKIWVEPLEPRQYLSISPSISGPDVAIENDNYQIQLSYNGMAPTSWDIDWGDGTTSGAGADGRSAEHQFLTPGSYTISAKASDGTTDYPSNSFDVNVGAFEVFGTSPVASGAEYTLTLPTTLPSTLSNQPILGWNIDWGDGSDPDGDGIVGQAVSGTPASLSHVFIANVTSYSGTDFNITATAETAAGGIAAAVLPVQVTPGLVISGPQSGNEGDSLTYTLTGPAANNAVWDAIAPDGKQYSNGYGEQFTLVPATVGSWTIQATSSSDGVAYTTSTQLAVAHVAPTITIDGPAVVFAGRSAIFSSTVTEPPGENDTYTYSWEIEDSSSNSASESGGKNTLPTYQWTASLDGNGGENFTANLQIIDSYGDKVDQVFYFQVLRDPGESNYESATVPALDDPAGGDASHTFGYAVTQEPDGKLLVAGEGEYIPEEEVDSGDTFQAYIARFNADLTLDTTFGDSGIVYNALGGYPQEYNRSAIYAIAVDPNTQAIIVTGNVIHDDQDGLVIASYYPNGALNETFGTGGFWSRLPTGWGTWSPVAAAWVGGTNNPGWTATPYAVSILPDSSILVGGGQTRYWYTNAQHSGLYQEQDFLLMKLNSTGELDTSFGIGGYAQTVNPMDMPVGLDWDNIPAGLIGLPTGTAAWNFDADPESAAVIIKILVQQNNQGAISDILVGGTAQDWTDETTPGADPDQQFVLAQLEPNGMADTSFGPAHDGNVKTNFPLGDRNYGAELSNMEILPSGDILAVGAAPNLGEETQRDIGGGDDVDVAASCLAMAWFSADGIPDLTLGQSDTPGRLITSLMIGGLNWKYPGSNLYESGGAITIDPDGNILLSTTIAMSDSVSDAYNAGAIAGWELVRITTNGEMDEKFGALGDGIVAFSPPEPFEVNPLAASSTDTGPINSMSTENSIVYTSAGIVALGNLTFENLQESQTASIIRYKPVLSTPTNLTANGVSQGSIQLSWTDPDTDVTGFEVDRKDGSGDFDPIAYLPQGTTSYTDADPTLKSDTTYTYEVRAIEQFGPSPTSAGPVSAATWPDLSNYGLVETLQVPVDGIPVTSGTTLMNGVKYLIESSGSFYALDSSGETVQLDSEYVINNGLWQTDMATQAGTVDVGTAFNGPGDVGFTSSNYTVHEDAGSATFIVLRTGGLQGSLTVYYSEDTDTAPLSGASAANFTPVTGSLTFGDGVSFATFTVPIIDDHRADPTLYFHVDLSSQQGETPFDSALVAVEDVDAPDTFTISASAEADSSTTQVKAGGDITLYLTRTGRLAGSATVVLSTADDTAIAGTDYTGLNQTVTFADGVSTQEVTIHTASDNSVLGDLLFTATLSLADGDTVDSIGDPDTVWVSIVSPSNTEQFTIIPPVATFPQTDFYASVVVTRPWAANDQVSVDYSITPSGSYPAVYGTDYDDANNIAGDVDPTSGDIVGTLVFPAGIATETIFIPLIDNGLYQPSVTLSVTLLDASGEANVDTSSATVTISNSNPEPVIQLSAASYTVNESAGTISIPISRTLNQNGPIQVYYFTSDGTGIDGAVNNINYQGTSYPITVPAGQNSIDIPILASDPMGGDKYFTVSLTSPTGAIIGSLSSATVTIIDNDDPPTIEFASNADNVYENSGQLLIPVIRGGDDSQDVTVDYTTSIAGISVNPATPGRNYETVSGTLTFPAGQADATQYIPVSILPDNTPTPDLSFNVILSNPQYTNDPGTGEPTLGMISQMAITIMNVDPYSTISFLQPNYTVSGTARAVNVLVTRTDNLTAAVSVNYSTVDGTAIAGTDYTAKSDTITFEAGVTCAEITIDLPSTNLIDNGDSFGIVLSSPSTGAILGLATTDITIVNPAGATITTVQFDSNSIDERLPAGSKATFTLDRSGDLSGETSITWIAVSGTAQPITDYGLATPTDNPNHAVLSGVVTFVSGQATASFTLPIDVGDIAVAKSFSVSLVVPLAEESGEDITELGAASEASVTIEPWPTVSLGSDIVIGTTSPQVMPISTIVSYAENAIDGISPDEYDYYQAARGKGIQFTFSTVESFSIVLNKVSSSDVTVQWMIYSAQGDDSYYELPFYPSSSGTGNDPYEPPSYYVESSVGVASISQYDTGIATIPAGSTSITIWIVAGYDASITDTDSDWFGAPIGIELSDCTNAGLGSFTSVGYTTPASITEYDNPLSLDGFLNDAYSHAPPIMSYAGVTSSSIQLNPVALVNSDAPSVNLAVTRTDYSDAETLYYSTAPDAVANAAISGTDYESVSNGILNFAAGQQTATITITLLQNQSSYTGDRAFLVQFSDSSDSSAPIATTTVIIDQLTDADKSPDWTAIGDPGDHIYGTFVTGTGNPLDAIYRNGQDIPIDPTTGEALTTAPTMTVQIFAPLPPTPAELTAQASVANGDITLDWQAVDWGNDDQTKDYYEIERTSAGSNDYVLLTTVPAGATTYVDTSANYGTAYAYQIIAHSGNTDLDSKASDTAYAMLVNHAPVVQPIATQELIPGQTFQYIAQASDPDGNDLSYSISGGPMVSGAPALQIDSDGKITTSGWTASTADYGVGYDITVTATDRGIGNGNNEDILSTTQSFWLAIVPPAPIKPILQNPVVTPIDNKSVTVSVSPDSTNQATDLVYQWTLVSAPTGAALPDILQSDADSTVVQFSAA